MDTLLIDVLGYLSEFIENDKYKCHLLMTCKYIFKCPIYFRETYELEKIEKSQWFDYFTDVIVSNTKIPLPLHCKILTFDDLFNESIDGYITSPITHLDFGFNFNQSVKKCIPNSVIYLTFGENFNRSIEDSIPSSVTHLDFGDYFDQCVTGHIPTSVTHLTFGYSFNIFKKNIIPSSVEKLILYGGFLKEGIGKIKKNISGSNTKILMPQNRFFGGVTKIDNIHHY